MEDRKTTNLENPTFSEVRNVRVSISVSLEVDSGALNLKSWDDLRRRFKRVIDLKIGDKSIEFGEMEIVDRRVGIGGHDSRTSIPSLISGSQTAWIEAIEVTQP